MSEVYEGYEHQYCELSDNLFESATPFLFFPMEVSADQRERMTMSVERLNQSGDRIKESRRTMLETEELGVSVLEDLHQQCQTPVPIKLYSYFCMLYTDLSIVH